MEGIITAGSKTVGDVSTTVGDEVASPPVRV